MRIYKIKQDHPNLPIIICGDSLYSNQPFITDLNKNKFSYILVAKPDDHKSLYEDIEGFRRSNLLEKIEKKEKGRTYVYEWINEVPLNGNPASPLVNFIQLTIFKGNKRTYRNAQAF